MCRVTWPPIEVLRVASALCCHAGDVAAAAALAEEASSGEGRRNLGLATHLACVGWAGNTVHRRPREMDYL